MSNRKGKISVNSLVFMIVVILTLLICSNVHAEERFRIEAESSQVTHHQAVKIVDDTDASSGKAIEIPSDISTGENVVSFDFPIEAIPGRYQLLLRLKSKDIYDLGKALRIEVKEGNILKNYTVAYGLYLRGKSGYQDFAVDCDFQYIEQRPVVFVRWTTGSESYVTGYGGSPNIRVDAFDFIRLGELPRLCITDVFPDRIRYLTDQDGDVRVTIKNYSQKDESCELKVDLTYGLEEPKLLGSQIVELGPDESKEIKFSLRHGGGLFGYAVTATLLQDGKIVNESEEYFTVHNSHWAVATGLGCGTRDEEQIGGLFNGTWHGPFTGIGSTDAEIKRYTDVPGIERDYTTSMEFGRMAGESFYMAPKEPVWIDPQAIQLESVREMQRAVAGLKRYGIGCHVYLANLAIGWPVLRIMEEHPEWFVYSTETGDLEQWYNTQEAIRHQEFWLNFDWKKFHEVADPETPTWKDTPEDWSRYQDYTQALATDVRKLGGVGFFTPNYKLPEVVDYVADQIIASAKMFGWDGIRWDCGNLETGWMFSSYKPYIDFYGKPLAETPEEMVEQTVANLKRLKAKVKKEFPNFVFGTNFGSWEEITRYPKMTEELCRDGGWMLNEWSNWYNSPTSPYHSWDKYYAIHSDTGEYITSRGGHYNPFSGSWAYPVDRLYGTIFMLAGKGHPHVLHYNSRTPAGNFAQFCVRFGGFIFDPNLRRLNKPERYVSVKSSSPIWWEKSVQRLIEDKKEYWIIHLINPPVTKEIETDPTNRLPEPVNNPMVSVRLPEGKSKVKAWALTAESWKFGDKPKTQAMPLEVKLENAQTTVTIPQVLYWKTVVFQFE